MERIWYLAAGMCRAARTLSLAAILSVGVGGAAFAVDCKQAWWQLQDWNTERGKSGDWHFADVNGDGRDDLLNTYADPRKVLTFLSAGDGTFYPSKGKEWNSNRGSSGDWYTGDVDGDGLADIVNIWDDKARIITFFGNGDGTFDGTSSSGWNTGRGPSGAWYLADVNGDGLDDVVNLYDNPRKALVFTSDGNGNFSPFQGSEWTSSRGDSGDWHLADVNGDGRADIVNTYGSPRKTITFFADTGGGFGNGQGVDWNTNRGNSGDWQVADVNGDGMADIINTFGSDRQFIVFFSNGDGTFQPNKTTQWNAERGSSGDWVLADIDGDGNADIMNLFGDTRKVTPYLAKPACIAANVPNGLHGTPAQKLAGGGAICRYKGLKVSLRNGFCVSNDYIDTSVFQTKRIVSKYDGENRKCSWQRPPGCPPFVTYLTPTQLATQLLYAKDGLLYRAAGRGNPFNTTQADKGHCGGPCAIYVMAPNGNIYAHNSHQIYRFHHSSFLDGNAVAGAGEFKVVSGQLTYYSNCSGHYRPSRAMLDRVEAQLKGMGVDFSQAQRVECS